jgi:general L-amino acid transport system permease protein
VLAAVGIFASFPLGVLLALGRRSRLPVVSWFSTLYIEVIRGMPLVTILFMSQIILPIFLPDFRIDKILRAMIGLTFFSTAYMAENVRGGLQGVPQGQYDAARALGLSYSRVMLLIILPQALRSVIPAIVGQFISLFKDTSLVAIIGLLDLLGIARSIIANPAWLGLQAEVYIFAAGIYFIFTYSMSNISRKIELALGIGKR